MSSPNGATSVINGKSKPKMIGKGLDKGKGKAKDGKSVKPGSNWQALKKVSVPFTRCTVERIASSLTESLGSL